MISWLFSSAPVAPVAPLTPEQRYDVLMARLDAIEDMLYDVCDAMNIPRRAAVGDSGSDVADSEIGEIDTPRAGDEAIAERSDIPFDTRSMPELGR